MTIAQVSQLPVEVLRANTGARARISQIPMEVLRANTGVRAQVSQITLEVLRPSQSSYQPANFLAFF